MNKASSFIRDHYTSIMLTIIVVSVAGSLVLLAFLSASLNQQVLKSNQQIELLKGVAEEISKDQQKQHDHQDQRQACFFNLFVTYTTKTPREPITQEEAEKCRVIQDDGSTGTVPTSQQTAKQQSEQPAQPTPKSQPNKPERAKNSQSSEQDKSLLDSLTENVIDAFRR